MTEITRAFCTPEVKAVHDADRLVTHLISNATLDRVGDIIDPEGWELDNYRANPVVVADHDYSIRSIIGVSVSQRVTPEGLWATTKFDAEGLGAEAFRLATSKPPMLRAWSVGFRDKQKHHMEAGRDAGCDACKDAMKGVAAGKVKYPGMHFLKQELLEYSAVAVPANPETVMSLCQRGLISKAGASVFFRSSVSSPVDAAPDGATASVSGRPALYQTRYEAMLRELVDRQRRHERGQVYLAMEKAHGKR